jgi:hypothetical protein
MLARVNFQGTMHSHAALGNLKIKAAHYGTASLDSESPIYLQRSAEQPIFPIAWSSLDGGDLDADVLLRGIHPFLRRGHTS